MADVSMDKDGKVDIGPKDGSALQDEIPITTTSTKNALITTQLPLSDSSQHRVKISIIGTGNVGVACAIAILMRRIASEICLIDMDKDKAEAEAEDMQHAGIFLGNPHVIGTNDVLAVQDSAVIIIAIPEEKSGGNSPKDKIQVFKKLVPKIAKVSRRSVVVVATEPTDVMSYVTWKLSKFPSGRVLGTGTLCDSVRFQYFLSKKLGLGNASINCMAIGAKGDHSVPLWSGVHVAGMKLCDINAKIGEPNDPENWTEVINHVKECEGRLSAKMGDKGPSGWCQGFCTAEIVDAILRNTKVVLPVSTYIHSCVHGTDKDVYMSVPCVVGSEGVHHTVRQKLTDNEKLAVQKCADNIRNNLRECGILQGVVDDED